ncbi:MAG: dihydrodipicolinate synthase family protein [Bryobacteraceae bacterium]
MTSRRSFLQLALAAPAAFANGHKKPMRGIFPIMQTPFSADGAKVDNATLVKEALFLDKCGAHGMVWPQLASEYFTLSTEERIAGAESLLSVAREVRSAVVIGVQADTAKQAVEYARHATNLGADALIALPPQTEKDAQKIFSYYKAIGESSSLPLFVQAIGDMSVDFIIQMSREIPTLRYIKDEAGPVLNRMTEFRRRAPELNSFTGNHGRTLYEEMLRGSAGSMPAAGFADLYSISWDLFQQGRRRESSEFFARCLLLISEAETYGVDSLKYILHLRGVFPNYASRKGAGKGGEFDAAAKQSISELLEHSRPHLRA